MRVLLDADELLVDFVRGYLDVVYECTGRRYKREDVKCWELAVALGLSEDEKLRVDAAIRRIGFCARLKVLPGAKAGLAKLRERHEVRIVTKPLHGSLTWCSERLDWLKRELDVDAGDVFLASRKHEIVGDVLVDDCAENVRAFGKAGLLWTQPHNANEDLPRVSSWEELINALV